MTRDPCWTDLSVIDVYRRETVTLVAERRFGQTRSAERRERGISVRRADMTGRTLAAWSEPVSSINATPSDPHEIAALDAELVVAQSAVSSVEIETKAGFDGAFTRFVTVTLVGVSDGDTLLSSIRVTTAPDVAQVVLDLERLRQAQTIATTATVRSPICVQLHASVAAALLAQLWAAHDGSLFGDIDARLEDHAMVGGGPFGAPFDDLGEPTLLRHLTGTESHDARTLGSYRPGFADSPVPTAANLRMVPPDGPRNSPEFEVLAIEHLVRRGNHIVATLLGLDDGGDPGRCVIDVSLCDFLAGVCSGGDEYFWTTGAGGIGSPWLTLNLGHRLASWRRSRA